MAYNDGFSAPAAADGAEFADAPEGRCSGTACRWNARGFGFITPAGEACFNVAIRTALIENGHLEFGVGGGIVWDSDADAEFEETLTKARILTQPRPDFQLLETMLWEPGTGIFLQNEHLQRLAKSAAYFDVPLDMHAILQGLEDTEGGFDSSPQRIRLLVSRDGNSEIQIFPLAGKTGRNRSLQVAIA